MFIGFTHLVLSPSIVLCPVVMRTYMSVYLLNFYGQFQYAMEFEVMFLIVRILFDFQSFYCDANKLHKNEKSCIRVYTAQWDYIFLLY